MADRVAAQQAALMAKAAHWKQLDQQRRGGGFLDESTTSRPVVGQNIVVGSRKHNPTKRLVRPPHEMPPASWKSSCALNHFSYATFLFSGLGPSMIYRLPES